MRSSSGKSLSSVSMSMTCGFAISPSNATVQGRVRSEPAFLPGSDLSVPSS